MRRSLSAANLSLVWLTPTPVLEQVLMPLSLQPLSDS